MVKTLTIPVSDELHCDIKKNAVELNITMREWIIDGLELKLRNKKLKTK